MQKLQGWAAGSPLLTVRVDFCAELTLTPLYGQAWQDAATLARMATEATVLKVTGTSIRIGNPTRR